MMTKVWSAMFMIVVIGSSAAQAATAPECFAVLKAFDAATEECITCEDSGLIFDFATLVCIAPPVTAQDCYEALKSYDETAQACVLCEDSGLVFDNTTNTCVEPLEPECQEGLVYDNTTNTCVEPLEPECLEGWVFDTLANSCVEIHPGTKCYGASNGYDNVTKECIVCEDSGLVYDNTTNTCVEPLEPECLEGWVFDTSANSCVEIHPGTKCYGASNGYDNVTKDCVTCEESGMGFNPETNTCVPCEDLKQIFSEEEGRCVGCIYEKKVWVDEEDDEGAEEEEVLLESFFCGATWEDASIMCMTPCPTGHDSECPSGESCYADTNCTKTTKPKKEVHYKALPTCGTSWKEAVLTCGAPCPSGVDSECATGEICFADTNCTYPIEKVKGGKCIDCTALGKVLHPTLKICVEGKKTNVTDEEESP